MEIQREVEEMKLHTMAKDNNFLEMWQGSQTLRAMQQESRAPNQLMIAIGYISDTEQLFKASWLNFHHDGAAEFKMSEQSPLPPALSAKDLPSG
jgi:hypothetical protein